MPKKQAKKKAAKPKEDKKKKAFDGAEEEKKYSFGETSLIIGGGSAGRGFEDVDAGDITVPQFTLLQTMSPLVQDFDKYKAGMIVTSSSNKIVVKPGDVTYLQFIQFYKNRIKWIPKSEGGGVKCMSMNSKQCTQGQYMSENGGRGRFCANCADAYWQGGMPPACTLYYNFPALWYGDLDLEELEDLDTTKQHPTLGWISFGKTNFSAGKSILNALKDMGEDIYSFWVEISTKQTEAKGFKFHILNAFVSDHVNASALIAGENAYKFLYEMKSKIKYGEDQQQEAEYSDMEENDEV